MLRLVLFIIYPFAIFANSIPITIEIADTDEERVWGLMGRGSLPDNHGMLFVYDRQKYLSVWMFNTMMDLSIAFIDNNGVITEIRELKAYPDRMDPERPVRSLKDLALYPPGDPTVRFFRRKRITSDQKVRYVLEMQKGWFKRKGVRPGDRLVWEPGENKAIIHAPRPE